MVQLAAFYDVGAAWNVGEPTPSPQVIQSVGAGLILTPWERLTAQIYWGYAFTDFPGQTNDLQDRGLQFRVSLRAF
jgi:hemolysin activation/secretion protein